MAMRTAIYAALTAICLALVCAGTAQATFPGKPGRIAFMQGDIGAVAPYGIATANFDGGAQTLIEGPTCQEGENAPCPANATWSRDGQRIVFDRGGEIAAFSPEGFSAIAFTPPGLTAAARPAFSPSAADVAFEAKGADGKRDIYIRNYLSGKVRRLTFAGGAEPTWSADNRIAFTRSGNLYLINPDGSAKQKLTNKGGKQADWSPDSKRLAFVRAGNTYRVDRTGKNLKKLTGKGGYEPAWKTDGTRVLFHRDDSFGNRIIYAVKLDGTAVTKLTGGEEGRRLNVYSVSQQPLP